MRVLLLTPRPQLLSRAITACGDTFDVSMATPDLWPENVDFIISFGYRHVIKEPQLSLYKNRMINIHISILPWNRGADPNLWSWIDNTPKGVSIHFITPELDKGPVLAQMNVRKWKERETLKSSYDFLNFCAGQLLLLEWSNFRRGTWFEVPSIGEGSFHKSKDKDAIMERLPLGWGTPVSDVEEVGRKWRKESAS